MNDRLVERLARAMLVSLKGASTSEYFKPLVSGETDDVLIDGTVDLRVVARACLSEIAAAGYAVVKREPTKEMIDAGYHAMQYMVMSGRTYSEYSSDPPELSDDAPAAGWSAMLTASEKG